MYLSATLNQDGALRAVFAQKQDEPGVARSINLRWSDFQDMGEPSTITVTVDPSDTLNAPPTLHTREN